MRPHVRPPPSLLVPATLHGRRAARRVPARTHPSQNHIFLFLFARCSPRTRRRCGARHGLHWDPTQRRIARPHSSPCVGAVARVGDGAQTPLRHGGPVAVAVARPQPSLQWSRSLVAGSGSARHMRCGHGATAGRHYRSFGNKTQIKSMASNEIIIYRAGCLSTSRDAGAGRHRRATARLTREASLTRARWTGLAIAPGALADLWTSIVVVEGGRAVRGCLPCLPSLCRCRWWQRGASAIGVHVDVQSAAASWFVSLMGWWSRWRSFEEGRRCLPRVAVDAASEWVDVCATSSPVTTRKSIIRVGGAFVG